MGELVSRASSSTLTSGLTSSGSGAAAREGAPPPPGGPSRSGSFLDSPEFAEKLERRKRLAEKPPSPRHPPTSGSMGHGGLGSGVDDGGLSYLEMLAERIAARQAAGEQKL